jgi:hypothetical protein
MDQAFAPASPCNTRKIARRQGAARPIRSYVGSVPCNEPTIQALVTRLQLKTMWWSRLCLTISVVARAMRKSDDCSASFLPYTSPMSARTLPNTQMHQHTVQRFKYTHAGRSRIDSPGPCTQVLSPHQAKLKMSGPMPPLPVTKLTTHVRRAAPPVVGR